MARFDVYRHPDENGFLLDVQANVLARLNTRVVVPLLPVASSPKPMDRLNPILEVGTTPVVLMTHYLSAVPTSILSEPVTNLESRRNEIVAALDFLQQGF